MSKRRRNILAASVMGLALCVVGLVAVTRLLRPPTPRYEGRPMSYWLEGLESPDGSVNLRAQAVVTAVIVPALVEAMFHDTNDSGFRMSLVKVLNQLPGVDIEYRIAARRRVDAAEALGTLGPAARAAIPDLIKVVKGTDAPVRFAAAAALGGIRSEPGTVIPLLLSLLDDRQFDVPGGAMDGLGHFGPLAKAAVPKLIPLVKSPDKDTRHAAMAALEQIDPAAAAKAAADARAARGAARARRGAGAGP
jgi:hypothetical protein